MPAKRPQDWTPEQKWEALIEASRLPEDQRGAFLRRRGLHQAHLDRWREDVMAGLNRSVRRSAGRPEARRVRQLERELARKEKALAEAAALLVLKKKSSRSGGTRTQT